MKNSQNKFFKCFLLTALLIAFIFKVDAQKAEFGIRFLPTVSSYDLKTSAGGTVKGKATFGFGIGAFLGINITNHVGIQGEVIYNSLSQKYTESDIEREVTLKYVNIPLLLSLNTGKGKPVNLNIVAGPQLGISVGSSLKANGGDGTSTINPLLVVKKGDLGIAYGAGLDFGLTPSQTFRLGLGFRGVLGLLDISDDNKNKTSNSFYILDRTHIKTYSLYAGISFLF